LFTNIPDEIEIPNPIPGSSNQESNAPVTVPRPKPVSKKKKKDGNGRRIKKIKNEKLQRIVLNLQIKKLRLKINKLKN
jgi:hypothetical protein